VDHHQSSLSTRRNVPEWIGRCNAGASEIDVSAGARPRILRRMDAEQFRRLGHALVDGIAR
jgi:hypothetical protein